MTAIATFKGVEFQVTSAERSGGRRGAVSEYPKRDNPSFDDQGRKKQSFPIEGFIVGPDYLQRHQLLIDKLESEGPGELIHPYYGSRQCVCLSFNVKLTSPTTSGLSGQASFTFDFLQVVPQIEPLAAPAVADKVALSALNARESVGTEFLAKFTSGPFLTSVADQIRALTLTISKVLRTVDMEAQKLALVKRRLVDLNNGVSALVREPSSMLLTLAELFDLIDSVPALKKVYAFNPGVRPPGTTRSRLIEQTDFDATQLLTQRLAAIRAAELAPSQTYDSYEDAVSARDELTALLDEQSEVAADDTYPDLNQLRADLVNAVPGTESTLPHLAAFTPTSTVPSIVLSHDLYGDQSREADLVTRNDVSNPGFIIGGVGLQVLTRG